MVPRGVAYREGCWRPFFRERTARECLSAGWRAAEAPFFFGRERDRAFGLRSFGPALSDAAAARRFRRTRKRRDGLSPLASWPDGELEEGRRPFRYTLASDLRETSSPPFFSEELSHSPLCLLSPQVEKGRCPPHDASRRATRRSFFFALPKECLSPFPEGGRRN